LDWVIFMLDNGLLTEVNKYFNYFCRCSRLSNLLCVYSDDQIIQISQGFSYFQKMAIADGYSHFFRTTAIEIANVFKFIVCSDSLGKHYKVRVGSKVWIDLLCGDGKHDEVDVFFKSVIDLDGNYKDYFDKNYFYFKSICPTDSVAMVKDDYKIFIDVSNWSVHTVCGFSSDLVVYVSQESDILPQVGCVPATSSSALSDDVIVAAVPFDPSCLYIPLDILDDVIVNSSSLSNVDFSAICDMLSCVSVMIDVYVDVADASLFIPPLPSTFVYAVPVVQVDANVVDASVIVDDVDKLSLGLKRACARFFRSVSYVIVDVHVIDYVVDVPVVDDFVGDATMVVDLVYSLWLAYVLLDGCLCYLKMFSDSCLVFDDGG